MQYYQKRKRVKESHSLRADTQLIKCTVRKAVKNERCSYDTAFPDSFRLLKGKLDF